MKTKHSKFWVALLMCMVIAVSTVMTAVGDINAATSNPKLEVTTTSGHRGDEVKVTVSLTSNPGLAGLVFSLQFDSTKLQLVKVEEPDSPALAAAEINDTAEDFIGYAYALSKDKTSTGVLYTATFKILDNAAFGKSNLTVTGDDGSIDVSNADGQSLTAEVVNGSINIECAHPESQREVTTTAATCTKDGSKVTKCKVCGETLSTETIKATGHIAGETERTEATCTTEGKIVTKCKVCGEVISTEILPKTEHTYGDYVVKKNATCQETGIKEATCKVCGYVKQEVIPKTDHTFTDYVITKEATCTEEGTLTATCTVCKQKITQAIPKKEHTAGTAKVEKEATCTETGKLVTRCTVCNTVLEEKEIPAKGHSYGTAVVTKEPTCTETGVKTSTCIVCGDVKTETIAALGHKAGTAKVEKEATCTETGKSVVRCTVCNVVIEEKEIPAKGHSYDAGKITKEPTCEETGVKTFTCTVCGDVKTETIAALGHSYTTGTIVKENTETEDGILERTCTRCGKTETVVLPKLESKNFEVIAEDGNVLPTTIYTNGNVKFTLAGIGMNNANPNGGDIRYVPVRWKFALASDEATANWTEVTDNMELNASQAGEYVLVVEYMREMYQIPTAKARATVSGKWVADSNKTFVAKTSLKVEEAPVVDNNTTEDTNNNTTNNTTDNSNDESVKTADTSVYSITLMMMLMLVAASVAVYTGKSKRAR